MTKLFRSRKIYDKHYRGFYYICETVTFTDFTTCKNYYFDGFRFYCLKAMKAFINDNYLN